MSDGQLEVPAIVGDKDGQPGDEANGDNTPLSSPSIPEVVIPEKYQGKSLEEVIKMHENAEKLVSKLGAEKHELAEQLKSKGDEDLLSLFSTEAEVTPQVTPENDEVKGLRTAVTQQNIALSIMFARQDASMPEWSKYEKEILAEAQADGAVLMLSPNWTKRAYNLVIAKHIPEITAEAEERGKNKVKEEEAKKIEATVIDASTNAPAQPKPKELTRQEKLALVRQGKLKMEDVIMDTLTDAERKS